MRGSAKATTCLKRCPAMTPQVLRFACSAPCAANRLPCYAMGAVPAEMGHGWLGAAQTCPAPSPNPHAHPPPAPLQQALSPSWLRLALRRLATTSSTCTPALAAEAQRGQLGRSGWGLVGWTPPYAWFRGEESTGTPAARAAAPTCRERWALDSGRAQVNSQLSRNDRMHMRLNERDG